MRETRETIALKIAKLKKRKEKLHAQEALSFYKEAQAIFQEDFTPSLALGLLRKSQTLEVDPVTAVSWSLMKWREERRCLCCCGGHRHLYN